MIENLICRFGFFASNLEIEVLGETVRDSQVDKCF